MPRIRDELFRCVVFLYVSEADAHSSSRYGGTGFVVQCEWGTFLVSNRHVAIAGGARFARVNRLDGGAEIVELPGSAFVGHEGGDDVAAAPLEIDEEWDLLPLPWANLYGDRATFGTRMRDLNVGVGDDVVMLGRFVGHDGRERNLPIARFGNIAMMPGEPVEDARGLRVDAFLAEMHSLPGFSGSPVLLHIGPGSDRGNGTMMPFHSLTLALLGIDTGHKQANEKVYEGDSDETVNESWRVRQNTGIAIVSPVWRIDEVLRQFAETGGAGGPA